MIAAEVTGLVIDAIRKIASWDSAAPAPTSRRPPHARTSRQRRRSPTRPLPASPVALSRPEAGREQLRRLRAERAAQRATRMRESPTAARRQRGRCVSTSLAHVRVSWATTFYRHVRPSPSLQWRVIDLDASARRMVSAPHMDHELSWFGGVIGITSGEREEQHEQVDVARRSFFADRHATLSGVGAATLAAGGATLQAQSAGSGRRQPRRHPQDNGWTSSPASTDFCSTPRPPTASGARCCLEQLSDIQPSRLWPERRDSAVVIVVRHFATVFAHNDAMWAKYGAIMSQRINFSDPQSQKPATINVYNSASHAAALPSLGNTLDSVPKRGCISRCVRWPLDSSPAGWPTPPERTSMPCATRSSAIWSPTRTWCRRGLSR